MANRESLGMVSSGSPQPDPADEIDVVRRSARALRRSLGPMERQRAASAVATHAAVFLRGRPGVLASYLSVASELDTRVLHHTAFSLGWQIALPCVRSDGLLDFRLWDGSEASLMPARFGLREPLAGALVSIQECQWLFLPGLAFDRNMRRLGQGGGYYDRTLATQPVPRNPTRLIGVGFAIQLFDRLPARPWDVRMDALLLDSGIISGIISSP